MQKFWFSILCLFFASLVWSDDLSEQETSYIKDKIESVTMARIKCSNNLRCGSPLVKEFYIQNQYAPIWTKDGKLSTNGEKLLDSINSAYTNGLNPESYHLEIINSLQEQLKNTTDTDDLANLSANLDTILTDAFFLYGSHLSNGVVNNKTVYPNWVVTKHAVNLIEKLNQAIDSGDINIILDSLSPKYPEYKELKKQLAIYQDIATKMRNWPVVPGGPKLKEGMHDKRITLLQKRLLASGELKSIPKDKKGIFDDNLQNAVIKYQKSNGLTADGVVGKTSFDALNVPLIKRIKQIELNMDRLRWLPDDLGNSYVMVNIPDFSLNVVDNGHNVLTMPVIVGKDDGLQSCVLSSQITYMDINPYWYIPNSIAIKDVLPKLHKDPSYLAKNNIKIYTAYGDNATEIDGAKIKWSKIESGNFIYKLRQEPGPKNPLGHIKFIFDNKCGIYLHDTSTPALFNSHKRDLSHGCIRIGKPVELAAYLASDKPNWSEDKIKSAIDAKDRHVITLTHPMNIHIVYATAWVNDDGVLQFRNDIYSIDDIPFSVALAPVTEK